MLDPSIKEEYDDQFLERLDDEDWCIEYLFSTRWPNGYTCSCCKRFFPSLSPRKKVVCPACGHAVTITSGTLLHGTKKRLSRWLKAIWFVCREEKIGTRKLQTYLQIKNYQTAWIWMLKLRTAMEQVNEVKCSGTVEISDMAFQPSCSENDSHHVIAALELRVKQNADGRLRMACCSDFSPTTLQSFIHNCVTENSTILLPDNEPYRIHLEPDYLSISEKRLPSDDKTREILNRFKKRYYSHTCAASSLKRLEYCLNEFCFQHNNTLFPDHISVFENMVATIMRTKPLVPNSCSDMKKPESTGGEE